MAAVKAPTALRRMREGRNHIAVVRDRSGAHAAFGVEAGGVLGVVTMQVFAVCVWRLLTKVRTGSVFSPSSFLYVNIIVGAIAAAAALMFAMAVLLALVGGFVAVAYL